MSVIKAIHSARPTVLLYHTGERIVRGEAAYQLPAPLFTQPTFKEAEAIRAERANQKGQK